MSPFPEQAARLAFVDTQTMRMGRAPSQAHAISCLVERRARSGGRVSMWKGVVITIPRWGLVLLASLMKAVIYKQLWEVICNILPYTTTMNIEYCIGRIVFDKSL